MNTNSHPHGGRRHGEEINRYQFAEMVVEKGLPRLTGWPPEPSQNSGDGAFRDRDTKHLQFAMNPRRTPQRIGNYHPLDQAANLDRRGWSAATSVADSGQAGPESAKPFTLPPDHSVSLDID
jgi:hypothetical protein